MVERARTRQIERERQREKELSPAAGHDSLSLLPDGMLKLLCFCNETIVHSQLDKVL